MPRRLSALPSFFAMIVLAAALPAGATVWGAFDPSRTYSGRGLYHDDHDRFRDRIDARGGSLAPGAVILNDAYLSTIEVFYTGPLTDGASDLMPTEQAALRDWVMGGGSLIVTTDIGSSVSSGDSILSLFGGAMSDDPIWSDAYATAVGTHPITHGVSRIAVGTPLPMAPGPDMEVLALHGRDDAIIAMVLDSGHAASGRGRVAMFGDHNMFDDVRLTQNEQLVDQLITWAIPEPSTGMLLALGLAATSARRRRHEPGRACAPRRRRLQESDRACSPPPPSRAGPEHPAA